MRRLVLICMMLLLPVQWTWSATASYCAHETGLASNHFGHHDHQHKVSSNEATKDSKTAPAGLDTDCHYCHLSTAQAMASVQVMVLSRTASTLPPDDPPLRGSHLTSGPERPDRLPAA